MKVVICASIEFTPKISEVCEELRAKGHQVEIPLTSKRILDRELSMEEFIQEKQRSGDGAFRKIKDDIIRLHYRKIRDADAILVLNLDKKGIPNYIGGNTFLEMGFAHVLNKRIFLLNDIPHMPYTDELLAMEPVVLGGNLNGIR